MKGRASIAACAGVLAAAGLSSGAPAQETSLNLATIAATGGKEARVLLLNADGTARRAFGAAGAGRTTAEPAWSPDGQALAFVVGNGREGTPRARTQIHVAALDGTGARRVTSGRNDRSPAWSPDGRRLAFAAGSSAGSLRGSIMVVNADGTGRTRLTAGYWDGEPAWSPQGAQIAFTRMDGLRHRVRERVWVMNADGTDPRPLANGTSPAWSPDGTRIAFASDRDAYGETCYHDCAPNRELYVMKADGSGETRITRDKGDDSAPAWSPDGARIAFDSDRNYPPANMYDVHLVNPDGTCPTRMTNSSPGTSGVAWRPGSGPTPTGPCGGDAPGAVTPVVEVGLDRARRGSLFLGESFRGMLLSHVEGGLFVYDDCANRTPAECLGQVQLQDWSICRRQPLMYGGGPDILRLPPFVPRYSWRRGALLADYGDEAHTDVHTGSTTVAVFAPRRAARSIVNALRPVGGRESALLPAPRFGIRVRRQIREVETAYRRLGSVARVRRALKLSRERVVQRLALGRALRGHALGPPTRC